MRPVPLGEYIIPSPGTSEGPEKAKGERPHRSRHSREGKAALAVEKSSVARVRGQNSGVARTEAQKRRVGEGRPIAVREKAPEG